MFWTVPLSIISSFSLYTQQWFMSYSLRAGSGQNWSSVLILLASCQQTCVTYTIAGCTVKNSWWWTEELSETCRVLFQKYIWEFNASSWFYYINSVWSFADLIPLRYIIPTLRYIIPTLRYIIPTLTYALASDTIEATCFSRVDCPLPLKYKSFKSTKILGDILKICEISQIIHAITNFT